MKTTALHALLAVAMLAPVPALAQQQSPAAAATLPNTFEGNGNQAPARAPVVTAPQAATPTAAPAAQAATAETAPDIARAETALRAVIANLKSAEVDYSVFSANLATQIREQAPQVGSLLTQFGEIKTVRHLGQPDGADMFRVDFENQATEWVIGFDNDDQIAALLFRPAAN